MPLNLINNPGAEIGNTNGWSGSTGSSSNSWIAGTTFTHSGTYKFQTKCSSNCYALSQVVSLVTGTLYQFSAWIQGTLNTGLIFQAKINNSTILSLSSLTSANTYNLYSTTFIASNNSVNLQIMGTISGTNTLRLDDISLVAISFPTSAPTNIPTRQPNSQPTGDPSGAPTGEPTNEPTGQPSSQPTGAPTKIMPLNLINNPGAETGNDNGWSSPTGSSIKGWAVTTTLTHSGTYKFYTQCSSNCYALSQVVSLVTGTLYQFSAWIRGAVKTGLIFQAKINNSTILSLSSLTSANTYNLYSTTFIASNNSVNLQIMGTMSGGNNLRLDDISLVAISFPTGAPTNMPTRQPNSQPTGDPSGAPTGEPTSQPIITPSSGPTGVPTNIPTRQPSSQPTGDPSGAPTGGPTNMPTRQPSSQPTGEPTKIMPLNLINNPGAEIGNTNGWSGSTGSSSNSWIAGTTFTHSGTYKFQTKCSSNCDALSQVVSLVTGTLYQFSAWIAGTVNTGLIFQAKINNSTILSLSSLTSGNTYNLYSTTFIASNNSVNLQIMGTISGTNTLRLDDISLVAISFPTGAPTNIPTRQASSQPTGDPSGAPTGEPTSQPIITPSSEPTGGPTNMPTRQPSSQPTGKPSSEPTGGPTNKPLGQPSSKPSIRPSNDPTGAPTNIPTRQARSQPTGDPSGAPTGEPTNKPGGQPSSKPSIRPSNEPTGAPTNMPIDQPTSQPIAAPSALPTNQPTKTSASPSIVLTLKPSITPTISPSFDPASPSLSIEGTRPNLKISSSMLGYASYTVPALSDIIIKDANLGNAYIIYGSSNALVNLDLSNQDNGKFFPLASTLAFDKTTRSLANIGDFNQDGFDDVILGDPFNAKAYVFYARNNSFIDMKLGFTITSAHYDFFGFAVASAGDFNNDGYTDLISSSFNTGKTYIIFGKGAASYNLNLADPSDQFITISSANISNGIAGLTVEGVGDINADGYDDVAITAFVSGKSSVYVIFGSAQPQNINLASLNKKQGVIITAPALTSLSLSNLGDINGDRIADFIIGTASINDNTQNSFAIYGNKNISNLNLNNLEISQGFKISGAGFFVSKIGDINNDGFNDIIVTNFQNWRGNINSYIFTCPDNITVAPTIAPSFQPTALPSANPSIAPSESEPTMFVTYPSANPSFVPSGPSKAPSFAPSKTPSITPSVAPSKTAKPSMSPTKAPTAYITAKPSFKPSFIPSNVPSLNKETSSKPSIIPSISSNDYYTTVFISTGGVHKAKDSKIFFVINSTANVEIIAGKASYIYQIVPTPNVEITISEFKIKEDIISLSLFAGLNLISNINYQTSPLTLNLPNTQQVILASAQNFTLTESNFIFASNKAAENSNIFDQSLITSVVTFLGFSGTAYLFYRMSNIVDYFHKLFAYNKQVQPLDDSGTDLENGDNSKLKTPRPAEKRADKEEYKEEYKEESRNDLSGVWGNDDDDGSVEPSLDVAFLIALFNQENLLADYEPKPLGVQEEPEIRDTQVSYH